MPSEEGLADPTPRAAPGPLASTPTEGREGGLSLTIDLGGRPAVVGLAPTGRLLACLARASRAHVLLDLDAAGAAGFVVPEVEVGTAANLVLVDAAPDLHGVRMALQLFNHSIFPE